MNNMVILPKAKEVFKELMEDPSKMFDLLRIDMKSACENAVSQLLKMELSTYLGRDRYERVSERKRLSGQSQLRPGSTDTVEEKGPNEMVSGDTSAEKRNYRNGYYTRSYTVKGIGTVKIEVPRDRLGEFSSQLIGRYDRYEKILRKDIVLMFLSGISTRGVSLLSKELIGRSVSAAEVSNVTGEISKGIETWRTRRLDEFKVKYMIMDGVNFSMRVHRSIEKIPMLIVIGVTESQERLFLCIQKGAKDSATTWREIFKDMKGRGLDPSGVRLGIMDGLTGLEKVFKEEFPQAKVQRCLVHVTKNVLAKVNKAMRPQVTDSLSDIFNASNKERSGNSYKAFYEAYERIFPSAVRSLESCIDSCLTFFSFPEEEWRSLRTTNLVERVNKEFKRRTKPMEILAGEEPAYKILCFVALRMELGWRCSPFGQKLSGIASLEKFTQDT